MASLYAHRERWRIQFRVAGKRQTLRLGKLNAKTSRKILAMMDQIEDELALTGRLSVESLAWASAQSITFRRRLAGCGVIPRRQQCVRLTALLSDFSKGMNVKHSTEQVYDHTIRNLKQCYGAETPVDEITDGGKFVDWLRADGLARATIGRRIKIARTIWGWAIEQGYVEVNPFKAVEAPGQTNPARKSYVPAEVIERIIGVESDPELRLVLALARFAGLRCPSEIARLRWSDINWQSGTMNVRSPKTEHHEGGESRLIPIFARVLPYLRAVFDQAMPGTELVLNRLAQRSGSSWTNKLRKRMARLDIPPWPRLWQNMRASCATDLAGVYRMPVVSEWMGHGIAMSQAHYQIVTRSDFELARGVVQTAAHDGGATAWESPQNPRFLPINAGIVGREGRRKRAPAERKAARGAIRDAQLRLQIALCEAYRRVMVRAAARAGGAA